MGSNHNSMKMVQEKRIQSSLGLDLNIDGRSVVHHITEAGCLYALMTSKRPVSRRNRASWYLRQLNKVVSCDSTTSNSLEHDDNPIPDEDINDGIILTKKYGLKDSSSEQNEKSNKIKKEFIASDIDKESLDNQNDPNIEAAELVHNDIRLISITTKMTSKGQPHVYKQPSLEDTKHNKTKPEIVTIDKFLVTPETRVLYLSKSIASSIILDLSPSMLSVSSQNGCVYSDIIFDSLKMTLNLLVRKHEIPNSSVFLPKNFILEPKIYISVIAYNPFLVARNNQVLVQNRRVSRSNLEQVLVELWISLDKLFLEIQDLISSSCGAGYDFGLSSNQNSSAFAFPAHLPPSNMLRHPSEILDDILGLGIFSTSLLPKLSRRSVVIISDGLFAHTDNLATFRLKNIALSFVSLCDENTYPDACFGYTPTVDLMKFIAMSSQGTHVTYRNLKEIFDRNPKLNQPLNFNTNPLHRLFCWTLHCDIINNSTNSDMIQSPTTMMTKSFQSLSHHSEVPDPIRILPEQMARFFCADRPLDTHYPIEGTYSHGGSQSTSNTNYGHHDWRVFRHMKRNLDADFEQVLSCLLREGYLIKSIQFKHKEVSKIVARLVLHWRHNLDLERELTAPYWTNVDPFEKANRNGQNSRKKSSALVYGSTHCEVLVHGSYSFLLNLFSDKTRRRSEYRDQAYKQFKQLIDGVIQTHDRLQYLSRYYKDGSVSLVPSFLLHGNSLLYEQPHTHKLTMTVENVVDETRTSEFQKYWQEISYLDSKGWKNLMHIHTLRLILEHDQPKFKNIHCKNANGRYTHVQCRRAMSTLSNFIKSYASFALLEDSTYVKFISHQANKLANQDDLGEVENSATKGFIVIRINKLLPILVVNLMFTSGIPDSHRIQIVSNLEQRLINEKLRNSARTTPTKNSTGDSKNTNNQQHSGPETQTVEEINLLRTRIILNTTDDCCSLIRSPLETMLKIYQRNFVKEFLINNWAYGLAGSLPLAASIPTNHSNRPIDMNQHQLDNGIELMNGRTSGTDRLGANNANQPCDEPLDYHQSTSGATEGASNERQKLIFSRYLSGFRVIVTINGLPRETVSSLTSNVLAKISAILVNTRIRQGFHVAFNNSGIINLVLELAMGDHRYPQDKSNCLAQYILFPPTIINNHHHRSSYQVASSSASTGAHHQASSKPSSLSGSLGTTHGDSFMNKNNSNSLAGNSNEMIMGSTDSHGRAHYTNNQTNDDFLNDGEIKFIREYWIEQQYGISAKSSSYDQALAGKRYPEIVDFLYETDMVMFDCLLTYDLLQLTCDKMSPYQNLDDCLSRLGEPKRDSSDKMMSPIFSPTASLGSCSAATFIADQIASATQSSLLNGRGHQKMANNNNIINNQTGHSTNKPSAILEGRTRTGKARIPLIEHEYKFSLTNFLDYCQMASLSILLFKEKSDFYEPTILHNNNQPDHIYHNDAPRSLIRNASETITSNTEQRNCGSSKREHRYSYQSETFTLNPMVTHVSLNHLFLDSVHRRLKQIHDKELKLSTCDKLNMANYCRRRLLRNLERADHNVHGKDEAADGELTSKPSQRKLSLANSGNGDAHLIEWRCFLRKGNQENQMIVITPASIHDIKLWLDFIKADENEDQETNNINNDLLCPIFVFRNSTSLLNEKLMSFLNSNNGKPEIGRSKGNNRNQLDSDFSLHLGAECEYLEQKMNKNEELVNELPSSTILINNNNGNGPSRIQLNYFLQQQQQNKQSSLNNNDGINIMDSSAEAKLMEHSQFLAFLRKIKNTILKSRFSSLSDAYTNELFIHKQDIIYYMENIDLETQKKYHVSSNLRNVIEFMQTYHEYLDSLPAEPSKPSNPLLTSILLQKCGIFTNLPIARLNESNPLMHQLNDKRLVFFMRANYEIELPVLSETLSSSTLLRDFIRTHHNNNIGTLNCHSAANTPPQGAQQQHHNSPSEQQQQHAPLSASASRRLASSFGSSPSSGSFVERLRRSAHTTSNHHTAANNQQQLINKQQPGLSLLSSCFVAPINDLLILEAFRGPRSCPMRDVPDINALPGDQNIAIRQEAHLAEVIKRNAKRKESHHYRRVLKSKANYSQSHSVIDQALKRVDKLGRLEHFCLTPLLFSPGWRSKLAPVRDHTLESNRRPNEAIEPIVRHRHNSYDNTIMGCDAMVAAAANDITPGSSISSSTGGNAHLQIMQQQRHESDERWHQIVCNNYLKEYEQYIQTLGFNSIQVRYQNQPVTSSHTTGSTTNKQHSTSGATSSTRTSIISGVPGPSTTVGSSGLAHLMPPAAGGSTQTATATLSQQASGSGPTYNTGYLIKFLNSGCLVFKVGFCKPYVYSVLYSIEGERFNNSNIKTNMVAFLDELDNIKLTMHLHSFTYDYHLRTIYSYISGRQATLFSPGYHLISFIEEFLKYYQKAPNYARNHILCDQLDFNELKVDSESLFNYIITNKGAYNFEVLEMMANNQGATNSFNVLANQIGGSNSNCKSMSHADNQRKHHHQHHHQVNLHHETKDIHFTSATTQNSLGADWECVTGNEHVLVQLKREKILQNSSRQDPDLFDCGLLVTRHHGVTTPTQPNEAHNATQTSNKLRLRYFLLLANQRDLYPKLVHTHEASLPNAGCHRPIRLGLPGRAARLKRGLLRSHSRSRSRSGSPSAGSLNSRNQAGDELGRDDELLLDREELDELECEYADEDDASNSELVSSGDLSGPASVESSSRAPASSSRRSARTDHLAHQRHQPPSLSSSVASRSSLITRAPVLKQPAPSPRSQRLRNNSHNNNKQQHQTTTSTTINVIPATTTSDPHPVAGQSPQLSQCHVVNAGGSGNGNGQAVGERAICDEEITYLGYFSTHEMDMLRFLQEKGAKLKVHIEQLIRSAELHFRRDYLWHKLMDTQRQRPTSSSNSATSVGQAASSSQHTATPSQPTNKPNNQLHPQPPLIGSSQAVSPATLTHSTTTTTNNNQSQNLSASTSEPAATSQSQELGLSLEELIQLLAIVEPVSLVQLDPQLSQLAAMHISWFVNLIKAFGELTTRQAASNNNNQSSNHGPRIHIVRGASRLLLLYMDSQCKKAFILISLDAERGNVELGLLLNDKATKPQAKKTNKLELEKTIENTNDIKLVDSLTDDNNKPTNNPMAAIELDSECRDLMNEFVNFCASFMWSSLLTN